MVMSGAHAQTQVVARAGSTAAETLFCRSVAIRDIELNVAGRPGTVGRDQLGALSLLLYVCNQNEAVR
jgi:hypothetical protein